MSQSRRVLGLHFNIGAQCRSEDILMGPRTSAKQALIHGGDQARGERNRFRQLQIVASREVPERRNSIRFAPLPWEATREAEPEQRTQNPELWSPSPSLERRALSTGLGDEPGKLGGLSGRDFHVVRCKSAERNMNDNLSDSNPCQRSGRI